MRYVVIHIGCLECGIPSELVGVFDEDSLPEDAVKRADMSDGYPGDWRGEAIRVAFPLDDVSPAGIEPAPDAL